MHYQEEIGAVPLDGFSDKNKFLEPLFASIPGIHFFVKNREGRFIDCNDAFAKMLGAQDKSQVLGKTDFDFAPSFIADTFVADDKRILETANPIVNKVELVPSDNLAPDWRVTSKIPIFGKDNHVIAIAGHTRNIKEDDAVFLNHPELKAIIEYVREHYAEKITIEKLATIGNLSPSTLGRLFKRIFNVSPAQYLIKLRLNAACLALRKTDTPISRIATQVGFYDQSSMHKAFKSELNITPQRYRDGERNGHA